MKLKFLLPACAVLAVVALASCKKDKTEDDSELTATYESGNLQSIAEFTNDDANEVLNEAAVSNNFMGSNFIGGGATTFGTMSCATVTVTPAAGFPKTVVIDFGAGCTSANGVTRSGKINVNITDSLRKPGSVATMTFDNYYVAGYKKEGTITWTNTSSATVKSWHRVCQNGKITAPNGNYWTHSGTQDITMTGGSNTPLDLTDDVFSITGNHTVTNAAGFSRTWTITSALEKKTSCHYIDMGTYTVTGVLHTAVLDFGSGACDNIATVSIDGGVAHTITLP